MRLLGKVAIITGGANGIGFAAAKRFCEEGAKVIIADFNEQAGVQAEASLKENGFEALFVQVDVTNRDSVAQMVLKAVQTFGTVHILVNNAGITKDAMLHKMTEEAFDAVLNVNTKGVFNCTQAILSVFEATGSGVIINTASVVGVYGNIGQTNYAASKAAVIAMTKTWAKELGRKKIRVNAVAPGFIQTAMTENLPEQVIHQMKQAISLKTLGVPEDIANAYLFLATDEASYITGHTLHVDGGMG
jgi:3-oxoacyl-[acyl-carrier protein] reductase